MQQILRTHVYAQASPSHVTAVHNPRTCKRMRGVVGGVQNLGRIFLNSSDSSPNSFVYSSAASLGHVTITMDVGRLVIEAVPSSSLEGTYTYGTVFSSQRIGTCAMTSMGEMSPAITQTPRSPFLIALTTSLTPRLMRFSLEAAMTSLSVFLVSFLSASGLAMGESSRCFFGATASASSPSRFFPSFFSFSFFPFFFSSTSTMFLELRPS
mmetsp:Transcript_25047/g.58379  ORF Transcript_25047/g.58379 Transcript_25047/m.58379 type:complete len:210 (-) Transcript_25047:2-631(-)